MVPQALTILCADISLERLRDTAHALANAGFFVTTALTPEGCIAMAAQNSPNGILVDAEFVAHFGDHVFDALQLVVPRSRMVILTGSAAAQPKIPRQLIGIIYCASIPEAVSIFKPEVNAASTSSS